MATLLILEPIYEQDFLDCSYGFRPQRSAHQAIDAIKQAIDKDKLQVYDADLKSYFDTIPHDKLMRALEVRIADSQVLKLIKKWLRAPIWEAGKQMKANDQGTPQGGIISPLLANLYMHWFDKIFHSKSGPGTWACAILVRYADDFVIMAKYMTNEIKKWIESTLEYRFNLTINKEKTKIVNLAERKSELNFLGFTLRKVHVKGDSSRKFCLITPSKKSVKKGRERVRELTDAQNGYKPLGLIVKELNQFLRGWGQYFSKGYPSDAFVNLNWYTQGRIYRFLQRRSQRGYKKEDISQSWYEHIKNLGVIQLSKQFFQMNA